MLQLRGVALVTLGTLGVATTAAAQEAVRIVSEDTYPPFAYADEAGDLTGVYPTILDVVFARLDGYDVTIEVVPWNRGLRMVEEGEVLGIFAPYASSGATRPYMDRYSEPIWTERVILACADTVDVAGRTAWPDDFHGLTVGNNTGYRSPGDAFFTAVEAGDITLEEAPDAVSNLRKLLAGRIDCYVNAALSIEAGLAEMGVSAEDRARVVDVLTISENTAHVGYATDAADFPYKDDFADQVDAILLEMWESGELEALVAGFFGT